MQPLLGMDPQAQGWVWELGVRAGEPTGPIGSDPAVPPLAGSGRRFQLSAVHTSKACNVISKYTVFVPVDLSTSSYLPSLVQYTHTGNTGLAQGWNLVLPGKVSLGNFSQDKPYEATAQFGTYTQGLGQALGGKNLFPWLGKRSSLRSGCPEVTIES